MGAHERSAAVILENLAIATGYALLGWLGQRFQLADGMIVAWPAAGFALAMLLLRGTSRWPGILLGSALVAQNWLFEADFSSSVRGYASAVLTGGARTLSAVVGAQLIRRLLGTTRWPSSVRGVIGFVLVAGLLYPALAAVTTHYSLLLGGGKQAVSAAHHDIWTWSIINSTGTLVVAPLILALATPPTARPRRSRWEAALLGVLYLAGSYMTLWLAREHGMGGLLTYPTIPLLIWAMLRFDSRGIALNNLMWAMIFITAPFSELRAVEFSQAFFHIQARIVVLSSSLLILAASGEERHQMREALEKERQGLERRVAERTRELARSLSLLYSSLESTADGLLVVDRMGRITAMNRRFAKLWGIPYSILETGDNSRALAFARKQVVDPEAFISRVAYLDEHPEQESADEIALKDGRIFERVSRPQLLGEEIIGRVWSFRDITPRRRAEAERDRLLVEESRARQAAEQASLQAHKALGLRDEFLTIAAHEMKTPVTSMKMQIQHLERLLASAPSGYLKASRLKAVAATASRQLKRLQDLGDQLLDVTRLTLGRLELRYEPLDLRELVVEQLESHAEAASRAAAELWLECGGPIPGEWDRLRLEQIVSNLLSNALKFGMGQPIIIKLEASADRARLQVIDRGIGIAPEDQQRIFERLERAVDAKHYGGLGMGLWIVQQSVEALGGDISVESAAGMGSTFTVELPQTPQPWQRTPSAQAPGEAPHGLSP